MSCNFNLGTYLHIDLRLDIYFVQFIKILVKLNFVLRKICWLYELMTCFHEFSEYESPHLFNQYFSVGKEISYLSKKAINSRFWAYEGINTYIVIFAGKNWKIHENMLWAQWVYFKALKLKKGTVRFGEYHKTICLIKVWLRYMIKG